ncbi:hypothetical protein LINPERPRIM_LOCUS21284, partial [Linum perenne]
MDPIRYIGKIITKDDHYSSDMGPPDIGGIVNYLPNRKLFQVVNQDGSTETIDINNLMTRRFFASAARIDQDDIKFDPALALWSRGVIDQNEDYQQEESVMDQNEDYLQDEVEFKFSGTGGHIESTSSSQLRDKGKGGVIASAYSSSRPQEERKGANRISASNYPLPTSRA